MSLNRVLVASPVCQKPKILKEFLESLVKLSHKKFMINYMFVDDNQDSESSKILNEFQNEGSVVTILPSAVPGRYLCNEDTHYWNNTLMLRVGEHKNQIIQYALDKEYDALFFVDSDLILAPNLLEHLVKTKKEVISEVFWTCWHPGQRLEPNVWLFDEYDLAWRSPGEEISKETKEERGNQFLEQLKIPGVYEVGGLGACTLISREALLKGVNFSYISNLTIHGEDRFFCIRAAVLGIRLYVDTNFPAYHIYRQSDLDTVPQFIQENKDAIPLSSTEKNKKQKIVLSMVVRNEEGRYLERCLNKIGNYIDEVVILDDASSDHTVELCEMLLKDIPHRLIRNETSMFANEWELRKKLWNETQKVKPDWILSLDADEVPEEEFWKNLRGMVEDKQYDSYGLYLYDMWNEKEYREDTYWSAHKSSRIFLLRYQPDFPYVWKETPQHCGRFPANLEDFSRCDVNFRIKHFGWARLEDRTRKYDRYRRLDPETIYGIRRQYDSILDSYPHLVQWKEGDYN